MPSVRRSTRKASLPSHIDASRLNFGRLDFGQATAWFADLSERRRALRRVALEVMEVLEEYEPYLYGSVLRGTIHPGSDVDLAAFADPPGRVVATLRDAGYEVELKLERSKRRGVARWFPHCHILVDGAPVEVNVYPDTPAARSLVSSRTGNAIRRASLATVRRLVEVDEAH